MQLIRLIVGLLIFACSFSASAQIRFDGNYWRSLEKPEATFFLIGYLRGADMMAYQAPAYICMGQNLEGDALLKCYEKGAEVMLAKYRKLIAGRAYSQFIDGLDVFFADYKNRSICVNAAVLYVIRDVNGMSKQGAEKWLTDMRALPVNSSCDY